jgi:hypothetical protein
MFDNLDDPLPATPAPIDAVTARGRRMRRQRRMLAGALALFVLAGGITTAAAVQGNGHKKVVVTTPPSSTTVVEDTTTIPEATSTTVPAAATSTSTPAVAPAVPTSRSAPATSQPPHDAHDLSRVTVAYEVNVFPIEAGAEAPINFTVSNNGPWDVEVPSGCHGPTLWSTAATDAWPPYTDEIWPQPYPARGAGEAVPLCASTLTRIPAGTSQRWGDTVLAGYRDAAGNVMPSPPGFTSYRPDFLPQCTQPCEKDSSNAIAVTIFAPAWPAPPSLYTIAVKTLRPHAASGDSVAVEMTYTNGLAFTVRMPLFGPCWTVKSGPGTVDCHGYHPTVVLGPHQTVDLVGTIWARTGFRESGTPLAAGQYPLDLGDLEGTLGSMGGEFPYLTVS